MDIIGVFIVGFDVGIGVVGVLVGGRVVGVLVGGRPKIYSFSLRTWFREVKRKTLRNQNLRTSKTTSLRFDVYTYSFTICWKFKLIYQEYVGSNAPRGRIIYYLLYINY